MCATAANLIENVLPQQVALRQWVLTFPFPWRRRLAMDGKLLGSLTRIFVETVHAFYAEKGSKSGAVTVVQRTSSDLRLNPHLHTVFLDGAYREEGAELVWESTRQLRTRDVGEVLEKMVRRTVKHLRRRGALQGEEDDDVEPEEQLAASAVSGQVPPAGRNRCTDPISALARARAKPGAWEDITRRKSVRTSSRRGVGAG